MAFLGQEFKREELPQGGGSFDPIPEGWYTVSITASDVKTTKAGTGQYISVRMDVLGPTHQGRVLFTNININNPNPKAEEIGRQQLNAIMTALGLATIRDTDQLIGGQLQVKVAIKHEAGRDPENDIKGFKSVAGSSMPPVAPKEPSTASAPTAPKATPPWGKKN